tara:strand:+ start:4623 stop:4802 length:180 start_codon:yes stop_codon:yes gene_type:complete
MSSKDDKPITSSPNKKYSKPKRLKITNNYSKDKAEDFVKNNLNSFLNFLLDTSGIERYY